MHLQECWTVSNNSLPEKILKHCSKSTISVSENLFNRVFSNECFPDKLKLVDFTPIFKIENSTKTKNCKPICVLPSVSKVFSYVNVADVWLSGEAIPHNIL